MDRISTSECEMFKSGNPICNVLPFLSSYETGNGIKANEEGTLKRATDPEKNDVIVAQGGYR